MSGDATVAGNINVTGDLVYNEERGVNLLITGVSTITNSNATHSNVTGVSTVGGDFSIADKIIHTGDTNTAIRFADADTITAETGGTEYVRIKSTGQVRIQTDGTSNTPAKITTS